MRHFVTAILFALTTGAIHAAEKPLTLSSREIADGWIILYYGDSTYGWSASGLLATGGGSLFVGGDSEGELTTHAVLGEGELRFRYRQLGKDKNAAFEFAGIRQSLPAIKDTTLWNNVIIQFEGGKVQWDPYTKPETKHRWLEFGRQAPKAAQPMKLSVPKGSKLEIRDIRFRPNGLKPLFNGKDLSGWKQFTSDAKRAKSTFSVTTEGWLNVKNGPGDLQTEEQFDDFLLQLECISNGKHLNSGIFFRCIPGEYQQGYEAQIQNGFKDDDRTKPMDHGTGGIQWRQPARRVVPDDGEWFTMTVLAKGDRLMTWVNGYATCDFKDERPPTDNARKGLRTAKGPISIQGHDPTTDLSFRNIRVVELK
jgi:hypothetical protein